MVQVKGRVACEMNTCEEVIATEALFGSHFETLDPAESVALLSALVFQQRDASEPELTPTLREAQDRWEAQGLCIFFACVHCLLMKVGRG